ncbi:DNA mismatch repair Msh6 [Babesia gibsoni]|uniref:DNA mismatch repair protein n=1 Tax=Babesia gibsoni TaxID=33632 RepID=A0AAD8LI33_BABGI|nr:DNA mismatch repair Msh6 [Babesia gibsoni]
MQLGIKDFFLSKPRAPKAACLESVSTFPQGAQQSYVVTKLNNDSLTQHVDAQSKQTTKSDKSTMIISPRDSPTSSRASQETLCADSSAKNAAKLFDDDESPVSRKRSLMFDATFVPEKLKCTEITEEFITSHMSVIEELIHKEGESDTRDGKAGVSSQYLSTQRLGTSQRADSTDASSKDISPLPRVPCLGSLKSGETEQKKGKLVRAKGNNADSKALHSSTARSRASTASDEAAIAEDGDVEEFGFSGSKAEAGGIDAKSITVGNEKFKMSFKSEDCVTDEERKMYLNCPASQKSKCFRAYVEHYYRYCNTYVFPPWVSIKDIRDKNGLRPTDEDYDPCTLWVPSRSHRWAIEYRSCHFTECMQQWWFLKQDRFDQLLFFKMGRFYELFYHDACIIQEICNLRWMGSENKPHVGFPEKSLHVYASACVSHGFKVVVIEQTETPQQLEKRNKETGQRQNTVSRAICEIITPGTIVRPEMLETQSRQLFLVAEATLPQWDNSPEGKSCSRDAEGNASHGEGKKRYFGNKNRVSLRDRFLTLKVSPRDRLLSVCIMDVSVGSVSFGLVDVSLGVGELRDLMYSVNPAEVVIDSAASSSFEGIYAMTVSMGFELTTFNCSQENPVVTMGGAECKTAQIDHQEFHSRFNAELGESCSFYDRLVLLLQRYLQSVMLDNLLNYCNIGKIGDDHRLCMTLDGAVISQLELFKSQEGDGTMSLFGFLNKTKSAIGERMLRRWLLKPLLGARSINERSLAVQFLSQHFSVCTAYQEKISAMPDLERSLGKVLNAAAGCYKMAVYFDDDVFVKLYELYQLLRNFEKLQLHVTEFFQETSQLGDSYPNLLRNMAASLVQVRSHCQELLPMLDVSGQKTCSSNQGTWEQSDAVRKSIAGVTSDLNEVLSDIKRTCPSAVFVHTKFRYEVEIPEREYKKLAGSDKSLEVTSTRSGFVRVRNDTILLLLQTLEEEEFSLTQCELLFFQHVVKLLHRKRGIFNTLLNTAAELDCLCSLASVAKNATIPMVRAEVFERGEGQPYMLIKDSTHPIVCQMNPDTFVPNDIHIGAGDYNTILLLTGPNMGGKSTLLRQTAICAIMAQMGSFVSASECKITAVDRVFTRLGAYDNLMQGKSTFLVELEEVSTILRHATSNSLVLVDELGRGTSTFDATAIAASSLEKISSIGSRCLFTTHFQEVCDYTSKLGNVTLCHMRASLDEEERNLVFLYKLTLGQCPESHGIHVAKLAGIPEHVVEMARRVSRKFKLQKTPPSALVTALIDVHRRGDIDALCRQYEEFCELYGRGNSATAG